MSVICPKCGEKTSKDDKICRNCGTVLKKEKKGLALFGGKKALGVSTNVPMLETKAKSQSSDGGANKFKLIKFSLFGLGAALFVVLIIMLIVHLSTGKGKKQAEKLADLLGTNITAAEKELEIHLKDNSDYNIVNKTDTFDYIYESEDYIGINDVSFPEWSVTVMKTSSEKIDSVEFTDYTVLKKDSRGKQLSRRPDLEKFDKNTKITTVLDEIDSDPFRITYDIYGTKYEYRYYYELDNGDYQSIALTVRADLENRFLMSSSKELEPFFISSKEPSVRADQLLQN